MAAALRGEAASSAKGVDGASGTAPLLECEERGWGLAGVEGRSLCLLQLGTGWGQELKAKNVLQLCPRRLRSVP